MVINTAPVELYVVLNSHEFETNIFDERWTMPGVGVGRGRVHRKPVADI